MDRKLRAVLTWAAIMGAIIGMTVFLWCVYGVKNKASSPSVKPIGRTTSRPATNPAPPTDSCYDQESRTELVLGKTESCEHGLTVFRRECSCCHQDQVHVPYTGICFSLIGGPCRTYFDCTHCQNAECKLFPGETMGSCSCSAGYLFNNVSERCELELGQNCRLGENYCHAEGGLACVDGVCLCKSFGLYDQELKKCLILGGSACDPALEGTQCIPNAVCSKSPNSTETSGYCKCEEEFYLSHDFSCIR